MSGKQKTDVAYTYSSKSHMHFRLIALCIFCLDWDQLGGPYGLFWGFSGFKQAGCLSFPLQPLCVPSSICFLQVLCSNVWFSTWWWLDISRCDNSIPVLLLLIMTNCQPLSLFLVFPGQPISFAKAWKICHNTGQIKETSTQRSNFWSFVRSSAFSLTSLCRSCHSHFKMTTGKKKIWCGRGKKSW